MAEKIRVGDWVSAHLPYLGGKHIGQVRWVNEGSRQAGVQFETRQVFDCLTWQELTLSSKPSTVSEEILPPIEKLMGKEEKVERKFSKEVVLQVWDDTNGNRVEIRDDRDGLGLVEIRDVSDDGKSQAAISMPIEMFEMFLQQGAEYLAHRARRGG